MTHDRLYAKTSLPQDPQFQSPGLRSASRLSRCFVWAWIGATFLALDPSAGPGSGMPELLSGVVSRAWVWAFLLRNLENALRLE